MPLRWYNTPMELRLDEKGGLPDRRPSPCPVVRYERAPEGYSESVAEWISNPHAYFVSFGAEARAFQKRHRSERLRTMTLVAEAEKLTPFRPVCISLDGASESADSWADVFSVATARLVAACPKTFAALQDAGELAWLGCEPGGASAEELLAAGSMSPEFNSLEEVVARIQWLFLMCGIRLNEVIVQVDPYTDEAWMVRKAEIESRRAADKAFMEGRRAAQKAWAEGREDMAIGSDGDRMGR